MDLFGSFHLAGELKKLAPNALTSPTGEIKGWEGLSWHWSVPLRGRSDAGNVKLFLLPSPMHPSLIYFPPTPCWNFSTKNLGFNRCSPICRRLQDSVLQELPVHSQERPLQTPQTLYAFDLMNGWVTPPLAYDAGSHGPPNAILSMHGCKITIVKGEIWARVILFSHLTDFGPLSITVFFCDYINSTILLYTILFPFSFIMYILVIFLVAALISTIIMYNNMVHVNAIFISIVWKLSSLVAPTLLHCKAMLNRERGHQLRKAGGF